MSGAAEGAGFGNGAPGSRVGGVLLALDPSSEAAPFRQLTEQIIGAVQAGALAPGVRLPAVRTIAAEIGVAAATAAKVYRRLEECGILETRGRAGTFVAQPDSIRAALARSAEAFAEAAHDSGIGLDEALEAVRTAFTRLG